MPSWASCNTDSPSINKKHYYYKALVRTNAPPSLFALRTTLFLYCNTTTSISVVPQQQKMFPRLTKDIGFRIRRTARHIRNFVITEIAQSRMKRKRKNSTRSGYISSQDDHPILSTINKRWEIGNYIGCGASGKVYEATDERTGEAVAVKIGRGHDDSLIKDFTILSEIWKSADWTSTSPLGFPKPLYFGKHGDKNVLIMSLLGPSLLDIMREHSSLSLRSALLVGLQILDRLELLHGLDFTHLDIKPENLLMGRGDSHTVYLVDFGCAREFMNKSTGKHLNLNKKYYGLVGTPIFASINSHEGRMLSRRDDLQSLGYVLIFLIYGNLPWTRMSDRREMEHSKKHMDFNELSDDFPSDFIEFLKEVHRLEFQETPDYSHLKSLLRNALDTIDAGEDVQFEWLKEE